MKRRTASFRSASCGKPRRSLNSQAGVTAEIRRQRTIFGFSDRHELLQSEDIFRPGKIFQTLHDRFGGNRMEDLALG